MEAMSSTHGTGAPRARRLSFGAALALVLLMGFYAAHVVANERTEDAARRLEEAVLRRRGMLARAVPVLERGIAERERELESLRSR
jgi:hypothetical protein